MDVIALGSQLLQPGRKADAVEEVEIGALGFQLASHNLELVELAGIVKMAAVVAVRPLFFSVVT